jgi:hypothetical protein
LKKILERLLPHRLRILWVLLITYIAFNAVVRVGLALYNGELDSMVPQRLLPALAIGLAFDIGTAMYFLAPIGLLLLAWPNGRERGLRWTLLALLLPLTVLLVFVGFAEFTFWNEFASRFNFIAVDYLIYTNEVVGNIRESYNLPLLLGGVGAISFLIWWLVKRHTEAWWQGSLSPARRIATALVLIALPPLATLSPRCPLQGIFRRCAGQRAGGQWLLRFLARVLDQ